MSTSVIPIIPISNTDSTTIGPSGTIVRSPSPIVVSTPQLTTVLNVRQPSPATVQLSTLSTQYVPRTSNVSLSDQPIVYTRDIPVITRARTLPVIIPSSTISETINSTRSVTNPIVLTPGSLSTRLRPSSPNVSTSVPLTSIKSVTTTRPPSPKITTVTIARPPSPTVNTMAPIVTSIARPVPLLNSATIITPIALLPSSSLLNTPVSVSRLVPDVTNTSGIPAQIFANATQFSSLPPSPIKVPTVIVTRNINSPELMSKVASTIITTPTQNVSSAYQSLIATVGLEAELLSARYYIEGTIGLTNEQNEYRIQYIKAINAKGQRVYIIVDVNGFLSNQRNLSMIRLNNPARVHHSTKLDAYDCVKNYVDGVAFEIGVDGLSTIIRDSESLEPIEINYALINQQLNDDIDNSGTMMTYPIIRMSQIRADSCQILQNSDEAFNCLRTVTFNRHADVIVELDNSFNNVLDAWTLFKDVRLEVVTLLANEITQLANWSEAYNKRTISTDIDRDKVNSIQRNLAIRYERLEDILRLTRKVVNRISQTDAIAAEINAFTEIIENNNGDLGTIL